MLRDPPPAKRLDPLGPAIARIADDPAIGSVPIEKIGALGEKRRQERQILCGDAPVAHEKPITRLQRDLRQYLARPGAAGREIRSHAVEKTQSVCVAACDPADAQPRQTVGF
jgi:hypothetical protein